MYYVTKNRKIIGEGYTYWKKVVSALENLQSKDYDAGSTEADYNVIREN